MRNNFWRTGPDLAHQPYQRLIAMLINEPELYRETVPMLIAAFF